MKKISGNKLLVKALREEGVDTMFGYPGACTIDLSDELYKQDYTRSSCQDRRSRLYMRQMPTRALQARLAYAW